MRVRRAESLRGRRKAPAGIPALLPKMRSGRLAGDDFFRATSADFVRLAAKLMRSYDLPACVELEDAAQELRLRVLEATPNWDPRRGSDLGKYADFVGCSKTRKMLDRVRGARRSTKESRYPLLLLDAVEAEEREALMAIGRERDPTPEEVAAGQERIDLARKIAAAVGMTVDELLGAIGDEGVRERVRDAVLDDVFAGEWEGSRAEAGADLAEEWS